MNRVLYFYGFKLTFFIKNQNILFYEFNLISWSMNTIASQQPCARDTVILHLYQKYILFLPETRKIRYVG